MYAEMAQFYDELTTDVPYTAMAEYIETLFLKYGGKKPSLLLELACGTGSMTREMAKKGYDMIAVDYSSDMLTLAREKLDDIAPQPLLLCQRMEELNLYGTVDGVISCLDSVNYLSSQKALEQAFERVGLFLEEGGLFIFDLHTEYKLSRLAKETYVRETENVLCLWQTEWNEANRLARFDLDFFVREQDERYRRFSETHIERAHTLEEIDQALSKGGMTRLSALGEKKLRFQKETDDRIYIVAQKTETKG
ncbi:MAG TPA: class I SAM-dependent methyltransferase [Clostridiales bacterium]|jgi:ubiquinone/menaquinone biosynthesis C-methylase UbiE|nr:class I SAM-dependent methyltransferase [Clostridiales bacterium]